jgi:hypothetical protein
MLCLLSTAFSVIAGQAEAQPSSARQGMSHSWTETSGAWIFNQAPNGTFNGTLTTSSQGTCPNGNHHAASGSLVNGRLTISATRQDDGFADSNPRPSTSSRELDKVSAHAQSVGLYILCDASVCAMFLRMVVVVKEWMDMNAKIRCRSARRFAYGEPCFA